MEEEIVKLPPTCLSLRYIIDCVENRTASLINLGQLGIVLHVLQCQECSDYRRGAMKRMQRRGQ